MKSILKRIDMIYIIGFLIILIGVYFNDIILLSNHPLYTLSTLFTPIVVQLFIWGGILVIVGESIITKDIYKLQQTRNMELGGAILYTLGAVILLRVFPSNVGVFLSLFLIILFVVIFLILRSHYAYSLALIPLFMYSAEMLDLFRLVQLPSILYLIGAVLILISVFYILGMIIFRAVRKQSVTSYLVFLTVFVLVAMSTVLHHNMYDTSYHSSVGLQIERPLFMCTTVEEVEEQLFLGVLSEDNLMFTCDAISYSVASHTEQAELYTYLLLLPLPILSWGANQYGNDISLVSNKNEQNEDRKDKAV